MHEVAQNRQRLRHDLVRAAALHVHHEADAAGVVLVGRIIETLLCLTLFQIHSPFSFTAGGNPAPYLLVHRSAVHVFELTSGGLARIGEIRSSARENLEKT
jgi:hypothetical protein